MSFQKIKIAKKAFTSSFAFDYSFQLIEGASANLQWLRDELKVLGASFDYNNNQNGEYIRLYSTNALRLIR